MKEKIINHKFVKLANEYEKLHGRLTDREIILSKLFFQYGWYESENEAIKRCTR